MHRAHLACFIASFVACGGSPVSEPSTAGSSTDAAATDSCQDLASAARAEVQTAITASLDCNVDADCIDTGFAAHCFDSCARGIASSGAGRVDAAKAKVNGAQCAKFMAQGCTFLVPPCVPPSPPSCNQKKCR